MITLSVPQSDKVASEETRVEPNLANSFSINLTDILLTPYRALWVLFDLFVVFWLYTIGVWSTPYEAWGTWKYQNLAPALVFTVFFVLLALGMGYYERPKRFTKSNIFGIGAFATVVALMVSLAVVYFTYYEVFGRLSFMYGSTVSYLGITAIKFTLSRFLRKNPYRFTILGNSDCSDDIKDYCLRNRRENRYYSYVDWTHEIFPTGSSVEIGSLQRVKVPNLVVAKSALEDPEMIAFALQALQRGCRVLDELSFYIQFFEKVPINHISENWILREGIDTRPIFFSLAKRFIDVAASALALILLSPLFLLISLGIKLTSPGPIFFVQSRMGRYCQSFKIFKFRTMVFNPHEKEIVSTAINDPRVTRIGKLMRPLHIDELPQLWNVLLGTMSLVGPRPEASDFAQKMRKVPLYDLRHFLRPGLTGHAQITQGYTRGVVDEMTEKLAYDLFYICNCSLALDIRIILRTVFCLVRGAR